MRPDVGTIPYLEDRWELVDVVGGSDVATVYLAEDHSGATARVKILDAEWASDATTLGRFAEEAHLARRIAGPNVAALLGLAVTWSGLPCIVYEHVEGVTLADRIARDGALGLEETSEIVTQIARALSRVHLAGVLFRDVTPENVVLVTSGGRVVVKLRDVGLATNATKTNAGVDPFAGAPGSLAPEILFGTHAPDARADLYALGVLAFTCLTGRAPILGANADEVLVRMSRGERAAATDLAPDLPDEIDVFFDRALHEDPFWRWATPRELADAFADTVHLARHAPRRWSEAA